MNVVTSNHQESEQVKLLELVCFSIKYICVLIFVFISADTFSQRSFTVGNKRNGIVFGNPEKFNGIKFNLVDLHNYTELNGFNLTLFNGSKVNGISLGIIDEDIITTGANFSIISLSSYVSGIKIAVVNNKTRVNGFSFSAFNRKSWGKGLFISPVNWKEVDFSGVSLSIYGCNSIKGLSISLFNKSQHAKGVQIGVANWDSGKDLKGDGRTALKGMQLGVFNRTYQNHGLQIGLINYSTKGKGVQVGIINIRANNPWYSKVLPIVNFKMDKGDEKENSNNKK